MWGPSVEQCPAHQVSARLTGLQAAMSPHVWGPSLSQWRPAHQARCLESILP